MAHAPRPAPTESIAGLIPPLSGFDYLAHLAELPFEPEGRGDSAVNASRLADLAFLVYGSAGFIEQVLTQSLPTEQGYSWEWLGTRDTNRGLILRNPTTLIVVFRGTRLSIERALQDLIPLVVINQDDLLTDGNLFPVACRAGGHVHAGFLHAFEEVSPQLDALVAEKAPEQRLWLTGHSLGGALATLAAAHLGNEAVQGLYTFGSPRVGDARFVAGLTEPTHLRFVHRDDIVPSLPPAVGPDSYVHAGTLVTLAANEPRRVLDEFLEGTRAFAAALSEMAQQFRLDVGALPFKVSVIADHAPVYYATVLWNRLLATLKES